MSDNFSDKITPLFPEPIVEEEPKKKLSMRKKWIIFISIIVLIVVILIWFLMANTTALDSVKRFFRYLGVDKDAYSSIRFDTFGNSNYALVDDSFAVASHNGLTLFSDSGSVLCELSGNFSNPAFDTSGDLLLAYDIGGTRMMIVSSSGETSLDLTVTGRIFDADLSEDGFCAVVYEGTDCYAVLEVYNEKGAKLYSHRSQSAFLNTCAISPDGSYVVATTLGQDDLSFLSTARIFSITEQGVKANISFGTQVICDIAYLNEDVVCAIGDESLFFFDENGKLIREYTQMQAQLSAYRFAQDKVVVLYDQFDLNLGYNLYCLGTDGNEIASLNLSAAPEYISVCDHYICLTNADTVAVYDDELTLQNLTKNNAYVAALARSDGTAVCVASGYVELYIP